MLLADSWQVMRNDLLLPVLHHPVSLGLRCLVLVVLDVHPSIAMEYSQFVLAQLFTERLLSQVLVDLAGLVQRLRAAGLCRLLQLPSRCCGLILFLKVDLLGE